MRILFAIPIIAALFWGCTTSFELPDTQPDTTILVVEGDILVGASVENRFLLSRVKSLLDTASYPEVNANVQIISRDGFRYQLNGDGNGGYSSNDFIPADRPFALRITTLDGKVYETPFNQAVNTPDIDSVTWKEENQELKIFVHSRDPRNATRNYRWTFVETWENRAFYEAYHDFVGGVIVPRPPGDQIFRCWKTASESNIILANTNGLAEDIISYQPVTTITKPSEKLYTRYSILVRQIGLTREAYDFWEILKKNTELTGSLFDPQPSRMSTNITCTNDPSRTAIGYVSVAKVSEKRLFIRNGELPTLWPIRDETQLCTATEFSKTQAEQFLASSPSFLPAYFITAGGGYGVAPRTCVDCRTNGGTNVQPIFW